MIFKKDSVTLGIVLGLLAPVLGLILFILYNFGPLTIYEGFQFMFHDPEHKMFPAALSVSLLMNALLFTIYINTSRDLTAKGIFFSTMAYGIVILVMKTIY
jgi:hypothetical protein